MKKLSLLIFFLVISEEFKSNLKVYVDNSDYPNIDE